MNSTEKDLEGLEEIERAVTGGDSRAVEALIESGRLGWRATLMALPMAIEAENPEIVGTLISRGGLDPNQQGEGSTPLGYAIENGSPDVVKRLCDLGADPNLAFGGGLGRRPLHLAVEIESKEAIDSHPTGYDTGYTLALLEAGADPLLEDENESNAIDEARGCRHRNAVDLMEKYLVNRRSPSTEDLKATGINGGERTSTTPDTVVFLNSASGDYDPPLAMSVDKDGLAVLRALGSTAEEVWVLKPNFEERAERAGYFIVNRSRGLALERPNPSDEVIIGDVPRLKLGDSGNLADSKRYLWSLRPVRGDGRERLWAIQDQRHAYSIVVLGHKVAEGDPIYVWAWSGESSERWNIRRVEADLSEIRGGRRKMSGRRFFSVFRKSSS